MRIRTSGTNRAQARSPVTAGREGYARAPRPDIVGTAVAAGKVEAKDVVKLTSATTVNGAAIAIKVVNGVVTINNATVTSADVQASNGVIHVIDTVILPPL